MTAHNNAIRSACLQCSNEHFGARSLSRTPLSVGALIPWHLLRNCFVDLGSSNGHSVGSFCSGVIYGDIGTSPLYVFASIFDTVDPDEEDILMVRHLVEHDAHIPRITLRLHLQAVSLIFWTMTLVCLPGLHGRDPCMETCRWTLIELPQRRWSC
jgi:hypothetical protein